MIMKHLTVAAPSALAYFAALVAEDDGFALLEAAICVAHDDHPQLDAQVVLAEIDRLAGRRWPGGCCWPARRWAG